MNRDKIRHKILKIIVDNYYEVEAKHGDGFGSVDPMWESELDVPVSLIVAKLKISYRDFDTVLSQAIRDKAIKYGTSDETQDCLTIASNTFLYYNERIYLNKGPKFKEKYPFVYDLIVIIITAAVSIATTLFVSRFQREKDQDFQAKKNAQQDSIITELKKTIITYKQQDSTHN